MGKKKNRQQQDPKDTGHHQESQKQQTQGHQSQQQASGNKDQNQQGKGDQREARGGSIQNQPESRQSQQQASGDKDQRGAWGGSNKNQPEGRQSQQQASGKKDQLGAWGGSIKNQPESRQSQQQASGNKDQRGAWGGLNKNEPEGHPTQQQFPGYDDKHGARGGSNKNQPQSRQSQQQASVMKDQRGAWGGSIKNQPEGRPTQEQVPEYKAERGAWGGSNKNQPGHPSQQKAYANKDQWPRGSEIQRGSSIDSNQNQQQGSNYQKSASLGQQERKDYYQQSAYDQQRPGATQQRGGYQRDFNNQQRGGQQYGRKGQDQLHTKMQQLSLSSNEAVLPFKEKSCSGIVRGTLGQPGEVEVNYLRLNLDKMPNEAYHYDVTITPDRPKKFLRPAFEQCRLQLFPNVMVAFDGSKSCYSMQRLPVPSSQEVEVIDSNDKKKAFVVEIKETDTCVVDLNSLRTYKSERVFDKPMRALQVLEVVLASNNHERGIRVGRSFFRRPNDTYYLEDGYEAWTGLFQAAILGEEPLLNVDIAHKSFPCESTLIEYLDNMRYNKNQDLSTSRDFCQFIKGINIIYTPPQTFGSYPRQYKVLAVGEPATRNKFKTEDGKQLTVENYYSSRGYRLQYPNLNCLTVGSTVKQISLPIELCSIPSGQVLNRKDQSRQVEKMVRYAATSTNKRKQKIMDLLRYFDHNVNPIIRSFGLTIGANFLKVPIRMLPSPYLEYLQGQTVTTNRGAWRMDGKQFLICSKPSYGHKWAIIYDEKCRISHHDLEDFKSNVIRTAQSLTMNLQNHADIIAYSMRILNSKLNEFAKNKYDLVFVVMAQRGMLYSQIKKIAELEAGLLTQCIKDETIKRTSRDRSVFSNILLKVNGKLNGTNHKIARERNSNLLSPLKNVMYLGADVTHPSPDQRHIPSVVGVAASHDLYGACYNCQYRLQRSTVENIEDMEAIVSRHLQVYYKYQNCYPGQILYYRDGVSDGQFPIVEREEVRAIRRACEKKGCKPKLTCIIVVKRHHTRFFPMKAPDHEKDFNNVQAGTVLDQFITHPNEIQFFMVSHQSIQGTARPTRYNIILDESKFDINMLQKLTYDLCHLFPRCNRAVSYPAPAYLAHLVAFRGRVYLEGTQHFGNLKQEYEKRTIKEDFMNRNPMYFI